MNTVNVVVIFIRNSKGEFFVHQRLSTKRIFPNLFGLGAGGHIDSGEEPLAAAKRELSEETKLTSPVQYLFTKEFKVPDTNEIAHLYSTESDNDIETDKSEWQWSGWMKKEEVDQLLSENKLCPDTAGLYTQYIGL